MKITVIGCGYLGANHATAMAELGHQFLGLDIDPHRAADLNAGRAPFFERGLDELLAKHTPAGSHAETAALADLHFIDVATPQKPGEMVYDLTHLFAATRQLAPPDRRRRDRRQVHRSGRLRPSGNRHPERVRPCRRPVEVCWNREPSRQIGALA